MIEKKKKQKRTTSKKTYNKIANCALKLFAKKGYNAVSIRDICNLANVNICSISYYFKSKKDLYKTIIENLIHPKLAFIKEVSLDFYYLDINEKKEKFLKIISGLIDYTYTNEVTNDEILLLFREQFDCIGNIDNPVFKYISNLLASILSKKETDPFVVLQTISILSQIIAFRIMNNTTLKALNKSNFETEDLVTIKNITLNQIELNIDNLIKNKI